MKKILLAFSLSVVFAASISTLTSCEDDPTAVEKNRKILTTGGPWSVESVTVDGADQTTVYDGLELTFANTTFSTVGGGVIWPASGAWDFSDKSAKTIIIDNDLSVEINEISQKKLVLELVWDKTTFGAGKKSSLSGSHAFTFTRP